MATTKQKIVVTAVVVVGLAAGLAVAGYMCYPSIDADDAAQFEVKQGTREAGFGADKARVDSQITLRIPAEQAEAVYEYLKATYVGKEGLLQQQFPGLSISGQPKSDVSIFTDAYFDTPRLDLYRTKNSARYRTRVNTTDPKDRKSGRELVQMKVTPPGNFTLRNELKYPVKRSYEPPSDADDLHPLISLIDKDQRADFKSVYVKAGINPYQLKHIFTIEQTRRRGYVNLGSENIFSFSVDTGAASWMGIEGRYSSVDLGLVEITYTEADAKKRELMWAIREAVIADLKRHFPRLEQNADSKYSLVLQQIMAKLPLAPALIRFGF